MTARLGRLFGADGRCFDVAMDHGFFGELAFLEGIENIAGAIKVLVDANPDAIQLSPGEARHLQELPGPKPALVFRTDIANVYSAKLPRRLFSVLIADAIEQAVRLDAACVVVNLLLLPDEPELYEQCIRNVVALKSECERYAMPLMVEPLVMRPSDRGPYGVDGDVDKIVPLVRQAAELGADIIKADPTDDLNEYHRVVTAAAPIPVLVRGGGRAPDEEILRRTEVVINQGAAGIVYGRNVIQHNQPAAITRALMAIVHDGVSSQAALDRLNADA